MSQFNPKVGQLLLSLLTIYNEDYGLGGIHHRTLCIYKVLEVKGNFAVIEPLNPGKDSKSWGFPFETLEDDGFVVADADISKDQLKAIENLLIMAENDCE